MKTLIKFSLLLIPFLAMTACRSIDFDPDKGIYIQLDIQADVINSNASKAGQLFEKTYTLNLRDTFAKRYNINPDKLDSFFVNALYVSFNQDRCKELQTYEVKTTFPIVGPFTIKDQCDLTLISGKPAAIAFDASKTDPYSKLLLKTNLADYIKKGALIDLNFKMIPKVDFADGFGVAIILATRANYLP